MSGAWVCDYCGERGRVRDDEPVELVLCPTCGEPVIEQRSEQGLGL